MTPKQTLTFWRLAVGNATSIPPTAIFNDEFERGLFKENPSGEWRLSKRHPDYRAYWCDGAKKTPVAIITASAGLMK